jgi:dipeptidyl aminopeptidase/acylaminoacyl peptidase
MTQEKRNVVPEDLFRMKFISGADLSPDGKRAAYALTTTDTEKDKDFSAIWLLDIASGESRQFSSGTATDSLPKWSPDGKQIAFLSNRADEKKSQIYVIPTDGGESRAVTSLKQGVAGGIAWSPDGKQIAFSAVTLEEARDPAKPYRVDRHVYRFDAMEYLDDAVSSIYVVDVDGGAVRKVTDDRMHSGNPQWSPDGTEILFTTSMYVDLHNTFYSRLRVVNLASGKIDTLVEDWSVSAAGWLPDGKRVVFNGVKYGESIGTKDDVWVLSRNGGTPENRTADLAIGVGGGLLSDMPVQPFADIPIPVSPDGNCAYVRVQDGGTLHLYEVALNGEPSWRPLLTGDRSISVQSAGDKQFLYVASDYLHPTDLFISNLDGSGERQLTHVNDDFFATVKLPRVENLHFKGSDGADVEGWIVLPTEGSAPFPTLLNIHGGPHWAFGSMYDFENHFLTAAGYAVLMVNHRASTGYGNEFSTAIKGDWGNLDYKDLMAGVDYAIEKGYTDGDRLGVFGISGGGNLSCWIVGQTRRFKAAVPENPVTNWVSFHGVSDIGAWFAIEEMGGKPHEIPDVYVKCSPITYAHTCITPTLLIQGEHDWRCPAEQSEQFYTTLKANGCIVEMLRLPNASHGGSVFGPPMMRRSENDAILEWMNRYVLGKAN